MSRDGDRVRRRHEEQCKDTDGTWRHTIQCKARWQKHMAKKKLLGLCRHCGYGKKAAIGRTVCNDCADNSKKRHIETNAILRALVIEAYGGICACCGNASKKFLTIDHVNNNGAAERRTVTNNVCLRLKRLNFPPEYRLLCFNCNCGRALNDGICPGDPILHKLAE